MTKAEKYVALVPMKGHSERVPRKNVREIGGQPLCNWILEALTAAPAVDRIVVNTDSEEIAALVTSRFDVIVHERPEPLQGDFVSVNRLIEHDMDQLPDRHRFLQTHATNPLLRADTIQRALEALDAAGDRHDSLFTVTRFQSRFYDHRGQAINHDPRELIRTQDLDPLYEENSNLYVFSRQSFAATAARIGQRPLLFEMDPRESLDIDEPADWELAGVLLRQRTA